MTTATANTLEQLLEEISLQHADHKFGCIKGSIIGQNPETGRVIVVPLCCKSWTCPACAVRLKKVWARRLVESAPERFLTLTVDPKLHPDPHEARVAIQKAWTSFVAHWRKGRKAKGNKHAIPPHELEYVYVWERHKSGFPHMHVLVRGQYIPQSYLKAWFVRGGVGEIVHIKAVDDPRAAGEEMLKYITKAADDVSGFFKGFRLISCSRNFSPGALPEPTAENTPGYDWVMCVKNAADVVAHLVNRLGFRLDPQCLPGRVELIAPAEGGALDQIMYELDPRCDFGP